MAAAKPKFKVIECDGLIIAATVETDSQRDAPIYYPANCLIGVESGQLNLRIGEENRRVEAGEFVFVRKYTQGRYLKSWTEAEGCFREQIFLLHDTFIKTALQSLAPAHGQPAFDSPLVIFRESPVLTELMQSLRTHIAEETALDHQLIRAKTMEVLQALLHLSPSIIHVFYAFSEPAQADLVQYMEHNFTARFSLEQFARFSGRSLSTFNREFRKVFRSTPSKWIKQRRLTFARQLLLDTNRTVSDICLEVGFEDLAHFSRSFKAHFGQNPSELINQRP